jgi:dTDP-4-dehydrorhamnose 3,5-epimerase
MEVKQTGIEGLVEIIPSIFNDDRGWFYEFYNEKALPASRYRLPLSFRRILRSQKKA